MKYFFNSQLNIIVIKFEKEITKFSSLANVENFLGASKLMKSENLSFQDKGVSIHKMLIAIVPYF